MFEKSVIYKNLQRLPENVAAYSIRQWNEAILVINDSLDPIAQAEANSIMEHELNNQSWKVRNTILFTSGDLKTNVKQISSYLE